MTAGSQRFQRRMLQVLLLLAIILLVWGLARLWLDGTPHHAALTAFAELRSPAAIAAAIVRAEPVALLCAGMALVAVTPALRLLLLLIDFLVQRDWLYVAISVMLAVIIALGGVFRLH